MTREEAIEVFKTEHPYNPERKDNDLHTLAKAFDMAISALSENKGDLISRYQAQAKLKEICERFNYFYDDRYGEGSSGYAFVHAFDDVPSVENKGEWLDEVKAEIDKAQEPYMTSTDYDEGVRFGLMLAYQIVDKAEKGGE